MAIITIAMGVGANKPTPINYVEPQTLQKNRANERSNQTYQQIIDYNGTTSVSHTSPYNANEPMFQNGVDHYHSSVIKRFTYNTTPYVIEGGTQENRIVCGYFDRREETNEEERRTTSSSEETRTLPGLAQRYELSTYNFYDAYMLTASVFKIESDRPTVTANLKINQIPYIRYYNSTANTITKNLHFESYCYIGYDSSHEAVYNEILSRQNTLSNAFNTCYNTPGSFQLQYRVTEDTYEYYPQRGAYKSPHVSRSYNVALYSNRPTYIIEFTAMRIMNVDNYNFNDSDMHITFGGSSTPPEIMRPNDLDNLMYQRNLTDETRLDAEYINVSVNQEIVDIPGLMWTVLSMPFAFISQAFNLTLFPGTPYAVNFSNLILCIFGVMVFIFIFKIVLKK